MADIYIFNYNNYYNREIKPPLPFDEMLQQNYIHKQLNVNFNPSDEVNTMLTVGKAGDLYDGKGDYLLVDEYGNGEKISRWFIIDHKRKCKGQWTLSLRRDVIADNYTAVLNSKCFVDRGTVGSDSPLIYNQEPIPVNQIKTSETLLKDKTGCAWICGFISRNYEGGELNMQISDYVNDSTVNGIENWEYYRYSQSPTAIITAKQPIFRWGVEDYRIQGVPHYIYYQTINFEPATGISYASLKLEKEYSDRLRGGSLAGNPANGMAKQSWAQKMQDLTALWGNAYFDGTIMTAYDYNALLNKQGDIIYDTQTGKFWRVSLRIQPKTADVSIKENGSGNLYSAFKGYIQDAGQIPDYVMNSFNDTTTGIHFVYDEVTVQLTDVITGSAFATMPPFVDRLHLKDAPYDMFCIPYGDVTIVNSQEDISGDIRIVPNRSMQIAQEIARLVGTSNIYDLQLLPYCPMTGFKIDSDHNIIDINSPNRRRFTVVYDENKEKPTSILLWSTASQGTLNIELADYLKVDDKKISNQCDMYRLASPNYNGQFEFSLAKNGGTITYFNVDFTYLPYKSYIHVNPQFAGLYGRDFNDVRGLICQGDFSINYLSDDWVNYQVSNKNYANIFARQIENLEVNHKYDRIENTANAAGNALATGIGAGVITGNVGVGVAAGITSAAAGVADVAIAEKRFDEQISFQTDIYNMQLDNIKAMPYGIASQTAYSANNKVFPILEYYTCTDEERTQVANYIAEKGMTLGVVGQLGIYVAYWNYRDIKGRGFVRATPIELNIDDDSHMAQSIAVELQKGVYFIS